MSLAQKVSASATLLAAAVFLFAYPRKQHLDTMRMPPAVLRQYELSGKPLEWVDTGRTAMDAAGILLAGGAVTVLLGVIGRKRAKDEPS